ncbi:hypothetical protein FJY84_07585 [Candidatus Bathyarchaeota archaeon]|nr:hypothetical protein [Candidatus Bathyarchaeota archaeon]
MQPSKLAIFLSIFCLYLYFQNDILALESSKPIVKEAKVCSDVVKQGTNNIPLEASRFTQNSKWVVMFVSFENVQKQHIVLWKWYSPDGVLYYQNAPFILNPQNADNGQISTWAKIGILNESASSLLGNWKVILSLDNMDIIERNFVIEKYNLSISEDSKKIQQFSEQQSVQKNASESKKEKSEKYRDTLDWDRDPNGFLGFSKAYWIYLVIAFSVVGVLLIANP